MRKEILRFIEKRIPPAGLNVDLPIILSGLASAGLYYSDILLPRDEKAVPGFIVSAVIYFVGKLADMDSTIRFIREIELAKAVSIEKKWQEGNIFVSDQPTEKELSRRGIIFDSLLAVPSIAIPPIGVSIGFGSFLMAINNTYLRWMLQDEVENKNTR